MPLDIQPLSPRRQALMLLVLLVLFGASLAFAQLIVKSRRLPVPEFVTIIRPPDSLVEPVRAYERIPGAILSGSGMLNGRPRAFVAFSYEADAQWKPDTAQAEALRLYELVLNQPSDETVAISSAVLAKYEGFEVQGEFGQGPERHFLLERMAVLPGRVVAICFSGTGRLTDGDKDFFENFCDTRVIIRRVTARTPSTRH